jgi:hypothetical protein
MTCPSDGKNLSSPQNPRKREIANKDAPISIPKNVPISYLQLSILKTEIKKEGPSPGGKRDLQS